MGAKLFVMPDLSIEDMIQTIKNSGLLTSGWKVKITFW